MAWWTFTSGRIGRRASEAESPAVGSPESSGSGPDPAAILSESCTFHAPAVVMDLSSPQRLEGRFASLQDREVVIDVVASSGEMRIQPLSACCVSFPHRGRAMVFLTRVRRIEQGATAERPRQLGLRLPAQIVSEDLRSAYRVNNTRGSGLEMTLHDRRGHSWTPQIANLSMSGCLIEFLEGDGPGADWSFGSDVGVDLAMGSRSISLCGVVRRREGTRWGLTFREALRGGDVDPPDALSGIVRELERRWSEREPQPPTGATSSA